MTTPRVYVLTIPYPSWLCESDRSLTHTILRRRSDGPLIVRERDRGTPGRCKDYGKLRYTGGRPHVQAIFTDLASLSRAQTDLQTFVPGLPVGVVSHERRRIQRPELPCTCVLPGVRALRTESVAVAHTAFPHYGQVATCPRHAQLLPRGSAQPLDSLVQRQVLELVQELPGPAHAGVPLVIDEPPALIGRSGKTSSAAQFVAELARTGTKFVLYG